MTQTTHLVKISKTKGDGILCMCWDVKWYVEMEKEFPYF